MNAAAQEDPFTLRWDHVALAAGGIALLTYLDEPLNQFVLQHRSNTLDDLSDVAKRFKDANVFYVAGGGAILGGLAVGRSDITRTGFQILTSYGLSSAIMIGSKWFFGRTRPWETPFDPHEFNWLTGGADQSFPSGSAAVVFSLATTLSDAVDRTPVSVILYTGAVANSWSRMYGNRHWFTDVAAAALIGIGSARIVNGKWQVFGFRPPTVGMTANGSTTLAFQRRF